MREILDWGPLFLVFGFVAAVFYFCAMAFGWIGVTIWFALGIAGWAYWPARYRANMRREDWRYVLTWGLLGILFGPFEFILGMPL